MSYRQSNFVSAARAATGRDRPALAQHPRREQDADCESRVRCPRCDVRAGQRCLAAGGPAGFPCVERRERREDLFYLLGCEWCRAPWGRAHNPARDGSWIGHLSDCGTTPAHRHVVCRACAWAATRTETSDGGEWWSRGPCHPTAAQRAVLLLRRVGQTR
jgi:hypothetical protein